MLIIKCIMHIAKTTQYTLQRIQRMRQKNAPINGQKIIILFQVSTPRKVLEMRHGHIAPWFWKCTKVYIAAQLNHHHPRPWEIEHGKKILFHIRYSSQRLGRYPKWNNNGQLDIKLTQKLHCILSNPQPPVAMRNETREKNIASQHIQSTTVDVHCT